MAVVKAFKWMRFLSDADEIRKKKENTKNNSQEGMRAYTDALQLRNMAFVELLKAGIPYIYIEDEDIIRINLDETSYDIDIFTVKNALTEEEFNSIMSEESFETGFNADKDICVKTQVNDELEKLRDKVFSYGMKMSDEDDYKKDRGQLAANERAFNREFECETVSRFDESYDEHYKNREDIIDYRIDNDGTARVINTIEYAVMGIEHGIGTTHTVMMFAQTLAKENKKVAIVEINNSNNMKDLGEWISGQRIETNNYPLGNNIDIYFGVDYLSFTAMYRDNYDYVIIDFGCYNRKREVMQEFVRISNKYILASGIEWNLPTLQDFYEDYIIDRNHSVIYLVPFLQNEYLKPIEKIVKPNKVMSIPYNMNPFAPEPETEAAIRRILGDKTFLLEDKQAEKPARRGLFNKMIGGR